MPGEGKRSQGGKEGRKEYLVDLLNPTSMPLDEEAGLWDSGDGSCISAAKVA